MKQIISILLLCFLASGKVAGQDVIGATVDSVTNSSAPSTLPHSTIDTQSIAVCPDESVLDVHKPLDEKTSAQMEKPFSVEPLYAPISTLPYNMYGLYNWNLHEGLNLNLGMSVMCGIGKHSNNSVGFAQNIAAMYALPINKKLSLSIGGFFNNLNWNNRSYRDGGLNAVLGYQFNENWEAYIYGQKTLTKRRIPLPIYDVNGLGDRIGAAVKYNFSPAFSIQVSVEERKY